MGKEDAYSELLNILEKDIVKHTITLFKSAGKTITKDEAENVIAKVGMKLIKEQEKLETLVKDFTTYIQSQADIETLKWLLEKRKKRINPYQDNQYIRVDVYMNSKGE